MILDTDKVMADTITSMDYAYAELRVIVADESILNVSCPDMQERRTALTDAINKVFETRCALHEMKRFVGEAFPK